MNNKISRDVTRITLMAHQDLNERVIDILTKLGLESVIIENARCVRQSMNTRRWGIPGLKAELIESPTEIFRLTVPSETSDYVLCSLVNGLELKTPGRGAVYSQDILEISAQEIAKIKTEDVNPQQLLTDLTLITGIQSKSNVGENLSRTALKLGAGVPVVGLGIGTGIRDRLGLLRITISPEKELIYLMVPEHDSDGLQRLLIDEGQIDRPGGGFLYQTPIRAGMVDPLLRIGHQEHAASVEQIIAAIDDIKKGTSWRKRFFGVEETDATGFKQRFTHNEINFFCHSDFGDDMTQAAMKAGALGATVTKVRTLLLQGEEAGHSTPCEHGVICLETQMSFQVLKAMEGKAEEIDDKNWILQSVPASTIFTHNR